MKSLAEKKAEQRLAELYGELVELAASCEGSPGERRKKAIEAIENLKITLKMLSAVRPSPVVGNYSSCSDPSEAVVNFLRNRGWPATEIEIIDGVFQGGFRGGDEENHRLSVDLAIRNRLTGTGSKNKKFGLKGNICGLIGLKDWDDAMFKQ